jgi:predicted O-methyltransferase YrrM
MTESPVLFLVFNRPGLTALVMEAIRAARPPRLYVAADGPRDHASGSDPCEEVRRIATAVDWDCEVRTLFRDRNLGCREAVSGAITWFFNNEEAGIILEDDCLPSSDFFKYCTELLERYRTDTRIMAICGSSYADLGPRYGPSYYFSYYADIWGWATWRRAWQFYDRDLARWPGARARQDLNVISAGRAWHRAYWTNLFDATRAGRINTWDYQWIYTVIEQGGLACYPVRNLISNLGFRPDATHTIAQDPENCASPAANLPHQPLGFPLVHPARVERMTALDQAIEAKRLGLRPPSHMMKMKAIARHLLHHQTIGMINYIMFSCRGAAWGGPFNGQLVRQALFRDIIVNIRPHAIVETGTYLGTTTNFLADTGLPIYSVEADPRNYGFARARFWRRRNVTLLQGDSRETLQKLIGGPLRALASSSLFFYLDAHWNDDLPLAEELELVFSRCSAAVVMIDDFQVPFDEGYGYDDYGPGKALVPRYIASAVSVHELRAFYPSTSSADESGARRGCVVLARHSTLISALSSLPLLCSDESCGRRGG